MSATLGDGITCIALAGGIVGYLAIKHRSLQRRMEVIHEERMAAMEKGIPLPEFPLDLMEERRKPDAPVVPILGMVLLTLSFGAMVVLFLILPADSHTMWVTPLPLGFLGAGFIGFHFLQGKEGR